MAPRSKTDVLEPTADDGLVPAQAFSASWWVDQGKIALAAAERVVSDEEEVAQ